MADGGWGSKKNGIRLGCFWDGIELSADGSQARIINARIDIDRDVNISDSTNKLTWSGGAVTDGTDSNINVSGSGVKIIKYCSETWVNLAFGSSVTATFAASMSNIDYAGATISNSETVTYPARKYLVPAAPTNVHWTQDGLGNFGIHWTNNGSGSAPWQTLTLVRVEVGGSAVTIPISPGIGDYADYGLALNKQYYWYLYAGNTSGVSYSAQTSVTPIPLHSLSMDYSTRAIGETVNFAIEKYGSSNTSTIYFIKNGVKTVVWDKQPGSSFGYTFTQADWSSYIPNSITQNFTVGIETYSGATLLGSYTYTITVTVPNTAPYLPTATQPSIVELVTAVKDAFGLGTYVKNKSRIQYTWSGTAGDGASVVKREIIITRSWQSGTISTIDVTSSSIYEETPTGSGSIIASCRTTDSRGRVTTSTNAVFMVYNYNNPIITTFSASRCDAAGNSNNRGTFVKFTINVSASSIIFGEGGEKNRMQLGIKLLDSNGNETGSDLYSKALNSTLTLAVVTGPISGPTDPVNGSYSSTSRYVFKITVNDDLTNATSTPITTTASISSEVYPLSIGTNGIGVGKVYDNSNIALDVVGNMRVSSRVGIIEMFAGSVAPYKSHFCDGSPLSTTTYPELFAVIGYTYGGSGTTFNIPNLMGKFPVGYHPSNAKFMPLGTTGGTETNSIAVDQMPPHNHGGATDWGGVDHSHSGTTNPGGSHYHAPGGGTDWVFVAGAKGTVTKQSFASSGSSNYTVRAPTTAGMDWPYYTSTVADHAHTFGTGGASAYSHQHGIPSQGVGNPVNNLPPYIAINYIIWY